MKTVSDICYDSRCEQCLDIHLPARETFPVLVYFHGGGISSGDKGDQRAFFEDLTQRGIAVVSANYRLYPQAKYPEFLEDAAAAVAWVVRNIDTYGMATDIFVGGSSAGGYISQMLCFDDTWLSAQGLTAGDLAGFVLDAGQPTCHFNVLRERGLDTRRVIVDETAPLYHVKGNQNYPPMLILVSDNDMENRYEQTMLLVSTLKHFGYGERVQLRVLHGTHCAYVDEVDENGKSTFGRIVGGFIIKQK